jgi:hypothetical protein
MVLIIAHQWDWGSWISLMEPLHRTLPSPGSLHSMVTGAVHPFPLHSPRGKRWWLVRYMTVRGLGSCRLLWEWDTLFPSIFILWIEYLNSFSVLYKFCSSSNTCMGGKERHVKRNQNCQQAYTYRGTLNEIWLTVSTWLTEAPRMKRVFVPLILVLPVALPTHSCCQYKNEPNRVGVLSLFLTPHTCA